ncbi:TadE/TadG family type IV pilus assembly protein [Shimia biformata]|uniref:TadE/TadG family type IV pilus assembly protein n=1 Tax=Shimia biformata TaxID=1294299 RepID=UPI001EF28A47|nr:TadE/TadG family type IV pilus assembly protein [Shimia biformata]
MMTTRDISHRLRVALRRFRDDESGSTLVEFALGVVLFLLIFLGLIDFGRMAFHYVTSERAMLVAARVAAVRPAACFGVPDHYTRGGGLIDGEEAEYGTTCDAAANICLNPGTITCSGDALDPTAQEIWAIVRGTLPNDADISNLSFTYSFDSDLGFLGGPYIPVTTVELQNLTFDFVTPLGALVGLAMQSDPAAIATSVAFPTMSVSMPGEDLAHGSNG